MIRRSVLTTIAELVPVVLILCIPFSAHAGGFFSSIMTLFSAEVAAEESVATVGYSAQQTPLLAAHLNSDTSTAIGGGDVFVSEGALVSTGPAGDEEIAASTYKTGEIRVYTVDTGDSLSRIAEMYGVTTNTILWANDLASASDIHPGDVLVILPIAGVKHTVTKGEDLSSIVKKYDADLDEVMSYNKLASEDAIAVGEELLIPGGQIAAPKRVAAVPTKSSGSVSSVGFSHPAPGAVRTQGIHGYNGVDFAVGGGGTMPIRAAAAGEVIVSKSGGWNGGYGNYIVIKHGNGTQTLYAHLSQNHVSQGSWVSTGQEIGVMGNSGRSTGTHLHFEVRGGSNPF